MVTTTSSILFKYLKDGRYFSHSIIFIIDALQNSIIDFCYFTLQENYSKHSSLANSALFLVPGT